MQQKTKSAYIIFLIGFLIFIIGLVLSWFGIIPIAKSTDAWLVMVFVFVIAFVLMVIGGHMLKVRFNRWMNND